MIITATGSGLKAENLDAVIDLGKDTSFSTVTVGFLQQWYAWIWLPLHVDVEISSDGKNFTLVSSIVNTCARHDGRRFLRSSSPRNWGSREARYIRVSALSRKTCPDWHLGAGQKAWIFVDEVTVQ